MFLNTEECVATHMHTASIMMLGIVVFNEEKLPPVWFEQGYWLTSAVYKEVLETKVLPWDKKIIKI